MENHETDAKCDTTRPLIYLKYEGPFVPVTRDNVKSVEDIQDNEPDLYFKIWFTEECFIRCAEKMVKGKLEWKDEYVYYAKPEIQSLGVKGVRELADGSKSVLAFDDKGKIIDP